MKSKIIYEKKYQHTDFIKEIISDNKTSMPSAEEYLQILEERYDSTKYVLIPERVNKSKHFIKNAIALSKKYSMDIRIEQYKGYISVIYNFSNIIGYQDIGMVFASADEIFFLIGDNNNRFTVILDYYTHKIIRNGKLIKP